MEDREQMCTTAALLGVMSAIWILVMIWAIFGVDK